VTTITATTKKNLVLVSGRAHPALAEAVAKELGTELVPTETRTFANGEIYARYGDSVGAAMPSSSSPTAPRLMNG